MSDAPAGLQNSAAVGVEYAAPGTEPTPEPQQAKATKSAAYDPSGHTVEEVQAYLAKHPDQADAVLAAEKAGKNRVTLTESEQP